VDGQVRWPLSQAGHAIVDAWQRAQLNSLADDVIVSQTPMRAGFTPVAFFLQYNDESDQYAFGYVLRLCDATAYYRAISMLKSYVAAFAK